MLSVSSLNRESGLNEKHPPRNTVDKNKSKETEKRIGPKDGREMVRARGIEPRPQAWEAHVLPIYYACKITFSSIYSRVAITNLWEARALPLNHTRNCNGVIIISKSGSRKGIKHFGLRTLGFRANK